MPYSLKTDLHTHTLFSGHAYSTVEENIREAANTGLEALAITDHFGEIFHYDIEPDNLLKTLGHFLNTSALPKEWHGVRLLRGVEIDIVDEKGNLYGWDMPMNFGPYPTLDKRISGDCDIVIASVHRAPESFGSDILQNTKMFCKVLENPDVLMIGHPGRCRVPFEIDTVLRTAKELGKIIEINEHSFHSSEEVHKICRKIAERCAELEVNISVDSDAHCSYYVGKFPLTTAMLDEIHFPEHLIASRNLTALNQVLEKSTFKK